MAKPAPVRVTFVSSHAKAGGAERYLETLIDALGPEWLAGVICLEEGPLVPRLRANDVHVQVVPTGRRPYDLVTAAPRLRRALRGGHPEVIHANGVKAALVAALALPGSRIPLVWVKHDFSRDGCIARMLARRCRLIVAVSAAVTSTFSSRGRIRIVHTGIEQPPVDRGRGRALLLEAIGAPPEAKVVLLVGRIDPFKGHVDLIEVAADLAGRMPQLRIAFVGSEDSSHPGTIERVRAAADASGLGPRIAFLGQREDAIALVSGADALVVPSTPSPGGLGAEGFGLVALEALAVGTPVVGYDAGATGEVVGEAGLLVPVGRPDELAKALERVLNDPDLAARLSCDGIERARSRFSLQRWVEQMRACYREAAG